MAAKRFLVLFASACVFKAISAQCIGAVNNIAGAALAADEIALSGNGLAYSTGLGSVIGGGLGAYGGSLGYGTSGYGAAAGYGLNAAPSSGGGFPVTSSSPFAPTGISVLSENAIEGPISITGQLPFLGAIALEGALPTAGAGAINYGCGNGAIGILNEVAPAVAPAAFPGYGAAGLGYPGLAGARGLNGLSGLGAGLGAGFGSGLGCGARY